MAKLAPLAGIAVLILLPFVVTSPFYLHLLITIAIYGIVALGLDIVFGYTGEVSIGHAALFGVGVIVGGLLLGITETLTGFYISSGYKDVPGLLLLLLVLSVKPSGLFGKATIKKV